jgi:hypothetical protein
VFAPQPSRCLEVAARRAELRSLRDADEVRSVAIGIKDLAICYMPMNRAIEVDYHRRIKKSLAPE